ncbi:DUF3868 domain-containing protein [Dysgonomonas sp. ZJ709]|uniref:DUF3868 domain-containing protein n=1 Tax=Dysgonomonas sp. ZJ709 TaxID=2709797 RepID=UPI0013EB5F7B|nr:DUF3868 domain-containing protein [Dysgonomonas sp. ZJ709]
MKQCSLLYLLLLFALNSWAQDYQGNIFFKSNVLKEENDSLHISFDIHIQQHAVKDYAAIRLIPELYGSSDRQTFPSVLVQGSNKRNMFSRWKSLKGSEAKSNNQEPYMIIDHLNAETDTILHYKLSMPYSIWMDKAVLVMRQEIAGYKDERTLNTFVLAQRVQLAVRTPYQVQPKVSFIEPAVENKFRNKQGQAFLDFQLGRSVILPDFRRNPIELLKIKDAFSELISNADIHIIGLFIEGYASPDGRYETNERLSKERAFAFKDYILNNYNLNLNTEQISVKWIAEDWDGLKILVQSGDIIHKEEILSIIDDTDIFDGREGKLMKLGGGTPYRIMLKDLFPQLRRVEYQINYKVREYSIEEVKKMIGKRNELLSHRELYSVAQSYGKESKEYRDILLDIIPKQFPQDSLATLNAAALMIEIGELSTAARHLERYADMPQAWNNLGVIYLYRNELDMARDYFKKAKKAGYAEAVYNLTEVEKKEQDNKRMERYKKHPQNN